MNESVLELLDVGKVYPNGTQALHAVDLVVRSGTVHALVGANGAGKSTMIEIIAGAEAPTSGDLRWQGQSVSQWDPGVARSSGVGTVHQGFPLAPDMSVLENVFMGHGRAFARRGRAAHAAQFETACESSGIEIDPDALVSTLPVGQRQLVGILQALVLGATLIVLDEPTASLSQRERDLVFEVIRRLRRSGTSFIYVSHHLDEVFDLSDEVTVLRDGTVIWNRPTAQTSKSDVLDAMIGAELSAVHAHPDHEADVQGEPERLALLDVTTENGLNGVSVSVKRGEVVGLFGMIGSGRTELLRTAFGLDKPTQGSVEFDGRPCVMNPPFAVKSGMVFLPEDRRTSGLFMDWEIWRNVSLGDLSALSQRGLIDHRKELERAADTMQALDVKAASPRSKMTTLSGGNQQKVAFARWVESRPQVWLLDEPTVAVDVHAKAQLLAMVRKLAGAGASVLITSSEPEELISTADRIVVMAHGRIVDERRASSTTHKELLALATGGTA